MFESISYKYEVKIEGFPSEWISLIYLYDPDLPLFPTQYIHALDPELPKDHRPGARDRIYGFIHHTNLHDGNLMACVYTNKDLESPR